MACAAEAGVEDCRARVPGQQQPGHAEGGQALWDKGTAGVAEGRGDGVQGGVALWEEAGKGGFEEGVEGARDGCDGAGKWWAWERGREEEDAASEADGGGAYTAPEGADALGRETRRVYNSRSRRMASRSS